MKPIALWPGHVGKPMYDPGACGASLCESDWTARLATRIAVHLADAGRPVVVLGAGDYTARARHADDVDAALVVHLHGDVGPPAVYYWSDGGGSAHDHGKAAAIPLATMLHIPWRPATHSGYPQAHGLLGRTRALGVLLELVRQTDEAAVRRLLADLDGTAARIAGVLLAVC